MRLSLTKLDNISLTIITILRVLSPVCLLFLVRPGGCIVTLCSFYFYQIIGKLTSSFSSSEVQFAQHDCDQFQYHRVVFFSQLKSKFGNLLDNTEELRISHRTAFLTPSWNLRLTTSSPRLRWLQTTSMVLLCLHTLTHPCHSQTSRLLWGSYTVLYSLIWFLQNHPVTQTLPGVYGRQRARLSFVIVAIFYQILWLFLKEMYSIEVPRWVIVESTSFRGNWQEVGRFKFLFCKVWTC